MEALKNFNIRRVLLLLKLDLCSHAKVFLWGLIGYLGMLTLVITLAFINQRFDLGMAILSSIFFMYIFGAIYTSFSFNKMHKNTESFSYLTMPASTLEKYFVAWFVSFVLYAVSFVCVSILAISLSSVIAKAAIGVVTDFPEMPDYKQFLKMYFLLNLFYILGSAYFKKASFILSSVVLGITLFAFILIPFFLFKYSIADIDVQNTLNFSINVFIVQSKLFNITVYALVPVLLIFATYFRLKEKEV